MTIDYRTPRPSRLALVLAAWLFSGCIGGTGVEQNRAAESGGDHGLRELLPEEVPLSMAVGSDTLAAEAYLWRDFMPGTAPADTGLRASIRLTTTSGAAVPSRIEADSAVVVCDGRRWLFALGPPDTSPTDGARVWTVHGGPAWAVGATAVVVLRIEDALQGTGFLRTQWVAIERTE